MPDRYGVITQPSNGCTAITNDIYDKIAFIYRGECDFANKLLNAQNAGALAVVFLNNQDSYIHEMSEVRGDILIPAVSVDMHIADRIAQKLQQEPDHLWHLTCPEPPSINNLLCYTFNL